MALARPAHTARVPRPASGPATAPRPPARLVVGEDSLFYKRGFPQRLERQLKIGCHVSRGGHMFPLERPEQTAIMIKGIIRQLQAEQALNSISKKDFETCKAFASPPAGIP